MAGLFALVPMTGLLTVSFFVLFAVLKTEHKGLKTFGKVIAVLLWLGAAIFLVAGSTIVATGKAPGHHRMMQHCAVDGDGKMVCPMMPESQPPQAKK